MVMNFCEPQMASILNIEFDAEARTCLENYRLVRDRFTQELNIPKSANFEYNPQAPGWQLDPAAAEYRQKLVSLPPHAPELIIHEADEVLGLADELMAYGFRDLATESYHTASVYYRVMESLTKSSAGELHRRLKYAAHYSRQLSPFAYNVPSDYFSSRSCANVYEINGSLRLGKGSYGSVYLAVHKITNDERAVKVMNVERVTSYYLRKLHTEINILRRLDHPNIISLQDVFFGRRSVYIVTPLCRGGELFELLNAGKAKGFVFKEDHAALLVRDMLSATHYLHSLHIVHRDLKLENFLFEQQHMESPLVLIDFGLARRFEPGERMSQRVGSCYYTAPEVLLSDYDHTCDVWSIGVLLYMLLSGSPPFAGRTPDEVYEAVQKQEAVYPEKRFGHLSPLCMGFMKGLLVKNPSKRMSTIEALTHPFIKHCTAQWPPFARGLTQTQIDHIVHSICTYLSADPLTRLFLLLVSYSLAADQVNTFRFEFNSMDTDHSGTISALEFQTALMSATVVQSGQVDLIQLHTHLCQQYGFDPPIIELPYHGYISAAMTARLEIAPERIRQVFYTLDPDKQGYITAESIQKYIGASFSVERLETMILMATKNESFSTVSDTLTDDVDMTVDGQAPHLSFSNMDMEQSTSVPYELQLQLISSSSPRNGDVPPTSPRTDVVYHSQMAYNTSNPNVAASGSNSAGFTFSASSSAGPTHMTSSGGFPSRVDTGYPTNAIPYQHQQTTSNVPYITEEIWFKHLHASGVLPYRSNSQTPSSWSTTSNYDSPNSRRTHRVDLDHDSGEYSGDGHSYGPQIDKVTQRSHIFHSRTDSSVGHTTLVSDHTYCGSQYNKK